MADLPSEADALGNLMRVFEPDQATKLMSLAAQTVTRSASCQLEGQRGFLEAYAEVSIEVASALRERPTRGAQEHLALNMFWDYVDGSVAKVLSEECGCRISSPAREDSAQPAAQA